MSGSKILSSIQCSPKMNRRKTKRSMFEQILEEELDRDTVLPTAGEAGGLNFPSSSGFPATLKTAFIRTYLDKIPKMLVLSCNNDHLYFFLLQLHLWNPNSNIQGASATPAGSKPDAGAEQDDSDDDFSEGGDEEQESVMKQVKFPEIEGPTKIAGAATKVSKCLEKRAKNLLDLETKYEKADVLDEVQKTFLSDCYLKLAFFIFCVSQPAQIPSLYVKNGGTIWRINAFWALSQNQGWRARWAIPGRSWPPLVKRSWNSIRLEFPINSPKRHLLDMVKIFSGVKPCHRRPQSKQNHPSKNPGLWRAWSRSTMKPNKCKNLRDANACRWEHDCWYHRSILYFSQLLNFGILKPLQFNLLSPQDNVELRAVEALVLEKRARLGPHSWWLYKVCTYQSSCVLYTSFRTWGRTYQLALRPHLRARQRPKVSRNRLPKNAQLPQRRLRLPPKRRRSERLRS